MIVNTNQYLYVWTCSVAQIKAICHILNLHAWNGALPGLFFKCTQRDHDANREENECLQQRLICRYSKRYRLCGLTRALSHRHY